MRVWDPLRAREGGPQRVEVGAVARLAGEAILGAPDGGGLLRLGVLHPVLDVVQDPVVDLPRRDDDVLLVAGDLGGQLPDLVVDHDVLVGGEVLLEEGAVGLADRPRPRGVELVPDLAADDGEGLHEGEVLDGRIEDLHEDRRIARGVLDDPVRERALDLPVGDRLRGVVLLGHGEPRPDLLGAVGNHDLELLFRAESRGLAARLLRAGRGARQQGERGQQQSLSHRQLL
jgi:hypothetical protein